jgi:hypothetical protein
VTRHGEVEIERLLALTFVRDRLQGGGSVLHVPGIDGTGWWFAFPRDSHADASALPVAPSEDEVRAFVSEREDVQAFSEGTGWLGSSRRPCCRLDLGAGTWVICFGTEAAPDWIRKLAAATDPEVAARMLAAAGLSIGWRELKETGKQPALRSRRKTGPAPRTVIIDPEVRRPGALRGAWLTPAFVVALLLLLAIVRPSPWPLGREAPEVQKRPDHPRPLAAGTTGKAARPAPQIVAHPPDPCAPLKARRPLISRFCAAVAARAAVDDTRFADDLRSLQRSACRGLSACGEPGWDAEMVDSLEDLYSRLLLSRFAGDLALHLPRTDPYHGAIKSIAPTAHGARRTIAQRVASDPDWQELWSGEQAPNPQELATEAMASLSFTEPRHSPPRQK